MHKDAEALVAALNLAPHPEGGYYRETFRSDLRVTKEREQPGVRAASTAIYYLLESGDMSALHRIDADEVWHFYDGDPLELVTLTSEGGLEVVRLGRAMTSGERPQHVVRAGVFQGARAAGGRFTLVGCTVAPGFEFRHFELPSRASLLGRFPEHASWVRALTRA